MRPTYADEAKWYLERSDLYKERASLRAEVERLEALLDEHRRCNHAARAWTDAEALRAEVESLTRQLKIEQADTEKFADENNALRAEVEALRRVEAIARRCAHNGGYLSSDHLIELRELLKK